MSDFVHLHNHSDFSLLDAAQSVEMMCSRVADLGMDSIALTEHGNLFSMIPFYQAAQDKGIKPIIGCEIYVAANKHTDRTQNTTSTGKKWNYNHLVLLVQNNTGYKNLLKLVSIGYLDGFYYRPRVDKELLKKYNEGLIATSACLAGEINTHAARGDYEFAKKATLEYMEIFPDRFYLELQNHQIDDEIASHKILKKLSTELSVPLVATNDCHYALEEHWEAHDVLFCCGMGKDFNDPNRPRYEPGQFYIKSTDEMHTLFKDYPGAIENTLKIAEQCNSTIEMGNYHLPTFPIPDSSQYENNPNGYLESICRKGLENRYGEITPDIEQRLKHELGVINKMGFSGYFLITQDFVRYAKNNKIPVGPGRGSAAGSLVAYSCGITDVDPLKYNLIFERFLNPDRVTMPDIDIDFCIEGRESVINYIRDKYGHNSVAQIITFGTMKAKSAIRDVGRVLGMSYGAVDRIAKMVPNELKMTLDKAETLNEDLKNVSELDDDHEKLIRYSKILEGMHRHASTHAAGVVVTPGPLTDFVPLYKAPGNDDVVTQVDMKGLEDLGLLKMDFLGLRNLTVINKTLQMIENNYGKSIDISKIDIADNNVYELYSSGNTIGLFQFESSGMREYLKSLQPKSIHDIIAMNALYRPGPMANIPEFINRKQGKTKITYTDSRLEPILKETYGIIVYQEQVMQIGSLIGGFTLAQSDQMRRAMGKKKKNLMATFKIDFVKGAEANGVSQKVAIEIFDLLEKFAEYGFPKSHSTAYAIISYQTAWLKHYYPAEFMAANLSSEINDTDRLMGLIDECKNMNLNIVSPNINHSIADFSVQDENTIIYGLAGLKGVGSKAVDQIVNHRSDHGKFESMIDLCLIPGQAINKKVLESLIQSGACDEMEGNRAQKFAIIEDVIKYAQKNKSAINVSQESLFGADDDSAHYHAELPTIDDWTDDEKLSYEKTSIGFYLTGNPLQKYEEDLLEFSNVSKNDKKVNEGSEIRVGGIIKTIRVLFDKRNRKWAIITLQAINFDVEVFVFSDCFDKYQLLLQEDSPIFIKAKQSKNAAENDILKVVANEIIDLKRARAVLSKCINIHIDDSVVDTDILNKIKTIVARYSGKCALLLHLTKDGKTDTIKSKSIRIAPSSEMVNALRNLLGNKNVWIS